MKCPNCGGEMRYKSGTSKTGKPYAGSFCQDQSCKFVVWDDQNSPKVALTRPYQPRPIKNEPDWNEIRARREESMEWFNAKNNAASIVAALIKAGHLQESDYYVYYKKLTQKIFGFQEGGDEGGGV